MKHGRRRISWKTISQWRTSTQSWRSITKIRRRKPINETITELIARRRRQMLVHSFLYYQMNENIIDDHTYDMFSKELAELQTQYPTESASAVYAKEFEEFDGSSGYDLPFHYPEVQSTAIKLLRYHKELKRNER